MKLVTYKNERSVPFEKTVGDAVVTCAPGATVELADTLAPALKKLGLVIVDSKSTVAPKVEVRAEGSGPTVAKTEEKSKGKKA